MFTNFFKTAFRNFSRHKGFSLINVVGLTVGLAACFLIYLYVSFETSYDDFNKKADRIYRLVCEIKTPTETRAGFYTSPPMGVQLKADFPEVEAMVRFSGYGVLVQRGEVKFQEQNMYDADPSVFSIFDFPLLKGDPRTALKEPFSVVMSETTAKKYFGASDPIGQHLSIQNGRFVATVTGVMKDVPRNSQIKADIFFSQSSYASDNIDTMWNALGCYTYLLLKPGTDVSAIQAKLPAFLKMHIGRQMDLESKSYALSLEPLKYVYLHSKLGGMESGNISNVYIFSIIALFILALACINFINLSTARAAERAKEVGIRKVAGAARAQLIVQFMAESMFICLTAFILAMLLTAFLLPFFNSLSGKMMSQGIFEHPANVAVLFLLTVCIGTAAGIYPALVLSAYRPVIVLKGRFITGRSGIALRKTLVIAQFTISMTLITGTIVVYSQLHFMRSQDLGFSNKQTLVINTFGNVWGPLVQDFKRDVLDIPGVQTASWSGNSIPGGGLPSQPITVQNKSGIMQVSDIENDEVDYDYIPLYKIKLIAGRGFSRDFKTDSAQALILNETAVKTFGYSSPDEAIGKPFSLMGRSGKIIGVVRDYHFKGLQEKIKPMSMVVNAGGWLLSVNVSSSRLAAIIPAIEKQWAQMFPGKPFDYYFADEFFDRQYKAENRFGALFFNFAVLAILISCLGLFGVASYSTIQRTKEIGIRKVLGASVSNILNLLSIDFLKLVFIAFVIASPIAWLVMNRWLEDFAYRITIRLWVFSAAIALSLLVALFAISFQTIKAAIANPVKSMRTD